MKFFNDLLKKIRTGNLENLNKEVKTGDLENLIESKFFWAAVRKANEPKKLSYPHTDEIIALLKKKFPCNNPASWRRNSRKQLRAWYDEYIRNASQAA